MPQSPQESAPTDAIRLLELVGTAENAQLVARCEQIGQQRDAIQQLQAVLSAVEFPYVNTYLSA